MRKPQESTTASADTRTGLRVLWLVSALLPIMAAVGLGAARSGGWRVAVLPPSGWFWPCTHYNAWTADGRAMEVRTFVVFYAERPIRS